MKDSTITQRKPLPPFTLEEARQKVRMAEDAWNAQQPDKIALAYTPNSRWRNRDRFFNGRSEIIEFLQEKWQKEHDYRLIKQLWAFTGNCIAVRFVYEYQNNTGQWFRAHGNENWQFDQNGLMAERHASINDVAIDESERLFLWPKGPRPIDHPNLSDLGL